jgi:hypothetical protein
MIKHNKNLAEETNYIITIKENAIVSDRSLI